MIRGIKITLSAISKEKNKSRQKRTNEFNFVWISLQIECMNLSLRKKLFCHSKIFDLSNFSLNC